jgi:ArsR family transcriptional regulator, virulence genes transcriptional regulator
LIFEVMMNLDPRQMQRNARQVARLLKTLASARRLMILCHLTGGERSVGELQAHVELSQSALSQHLGRLRREGVVATRRDGQTIYYTLTDPNVIAVMRALYDVYCARMARSGWQRRRSNGAGRGRTAANAAHVA